MKSLNNFKVTINGEDITITAKIGEWQPSLRVQQVTIGHQSPHNPSWVRHCQISDSDFIVSRMMSGVTVSWDDWIEVATQIEPKLASIPTFSKQPTADNLSVVVDTEIPAEYQWSGSDDAKTFKFIEGAKSETLDKSQATFKFVVCSVKNASGQVDSNIIKL